jgi:class 3 adenylate cyclase
VGDSGSCANDAVQSCCLVCAGRADYFGLAVNRAARFLGAACGGQVLAERGLVEEVVQYWHSLVYKWVN